MNARMTKGLRLVLRRQFAGHIIRALYGSAYHSRPQRLLINPIPAQSLAEIQPIRHVKVSVAKQVEDRRNKFTIRRLDHSNEIRDYLRSLDVLVIHMRRRNLLRKYCSYLIARRTGCWQVDSPDQQSCQTVKIDQDESVAYISDTHWRITAETRPSSPTAGLWRSVMSSCWRTPRRSYRECSLSSVCRTILCVPRPVGRSGGG